MEPVEGSMSEHDKVFMNQTVGKNKEFKKTSEIPGTEHMHICTVCAYHLSRY